MRHWQRTIEQGNRCFVTGALIDAREHYLRIPRHSDTQPTLIRTPVPRS
ncbi:hypothetical protein ACSEUW_30745, partial [Pseudomonas aeruginosa]